MGSWSKNKPDNSWWACLSSVLCVQSLKENSPNISTFLHRMSSVNCAWGPLKAIAILRCIVLWACLRYFHFSYSFPIWFPHNSRRQPPRCLKAEPKESTLNRLLVVTIATAGQMFNTDDAALAVHQPSLRVVFLITRRTQVWFIASIFNSASD